MINQVAQGAISRNKTKARNLSQWLSRWPVLIYRLHLGWLLGQRFMLVTHRGRRSGRLRQTGVMVLHYDRNNHVARVVAGSRKADWYRNIQASPAVKITIGRECYQPVQSFLEPNEIALLLRWSRRHHPITARIQSMFFGWPGNPSNAELLDLAHLLGGVTFQPVRTNVEAEW